MLAIASSWLKGINYVMGIEVLIRSDQSRLFRVVVLSNKGGEVKCVATYTTDDFSSLDIPYGGNEIPVALCISGKGVLFREVTGPENQLEDKIRSAVPSIQSGEIAVQRYPCKEGVYLTLLRKELVDEIINLISSKYSHILYLSAGPTGVHQFFSLTGTDLSSTISGDYELLSDKEGNLLSIKTISGVDKAYFFGEDCISSSFLSAYATACMLAIGIDKKINRVSIDYTDHQEQFKKWNQIILKKRWGVATLCITLILLIINFLVYNHYRNKNQEYQSKLFLYKAKLNQLDSLTKYVKEKDQLVEVMGIESNTSISHLLDEIAASVPPSILLTELSVNPLDPLLSRKEKTSVFVVNGLVIKGATNSVESLNEWIKELKDVYGMKMIGIEEYRYDTTLGSGVFILKGSLK